MKKLNYSYPLITSFPLYSALFTIFSSDEDLIDWLCIQYINISAYFINDKKNDLWVDLYSRISDGMNRPIFARCPYLIYNKISRRHIKSKEIFYNYIKNAIDNNEYVYFNINPKCIKEYNLKVETIFTEHECLISGYDEEKRTFICSDFFSEQKYKFIEISCDELYNSFISLSVNKDEYLLDSIYSIKLSNQKVSHDYYSYYIMLCEYIGKRQCSLCVPMGLHVYELLIEYIKACQDTRKQLDYRIFSLISDHKTIIIRAMNHISRYIDDGLFTFTLHNQLLEISKMVNRLVYKCVKKNNFDYSKIIDLIYQMREIEESIIYEAIINFEIKYNIEPYGIY